MDKNLNNQPPIENDVVSQIESQFEQQQTMKPQMNTNLQQQYKSMQEPNIDVKKKGIGLGLFSLIVSIITFICGLFQSIYGPVSVIDGLFSVINGLFPSLVSIVLCINIPGAIITLILGIIALIKNRMLGKILAIIALLIILGSIILDYYVVLFGLFYDF